MARLCRQEIIGNIGALPEKKSKEGETTFCVMTVAVDRLPRKGVTEKPKPLWYRVSLWGKQADTALALAYKGAPVLVMGNFDVTEYQGRQTLEIAANEFQLLGESPTSQSAKLDAAIDADRQTRPGGVGGGSGAGNLREGY